MWEDRFLFDARNILFITNDGILYSADTGNKVMHYSFADNTSHEAVLQKSEEPDNLSMDSCLTYDEKTFYFYDYGTYSGFPRIIRVSRTDWSYEVVAEDEVLTEAPKVNNVGSAAKDPNACQIGGLMISLDPDIWNCKNFQVVREVESQGIIRSSDSDAFIEESNNIENYRKSNTPL